MTTLSFIGWLAAGSVSVWLLVTFLLSRLTAKEGRTWFWEWPLWIPFVFFIVVCWPIYEWIQERKNRRAP